VDYVEVRDSMLWCGLVWCGKFESLQFDDILCCGVVLYGVLWCFVVCYSAVWRCVVADVELLGLMECMAWFVGVV
jgi:hypothetical protein